jgi:hypothetical protein
MTLYPQNIDDNASLPPATGSDPISLAVNAVREAVIAIENELGTNVKGFYSNVRTRIEVIETKLSTIGIGGNLTVNTLTANAVNTGYIRISSMPATITTGAGYIAFDGTKFRAVQDGVNYFNLSTSVQVLVDSNAIMTDDTDILVITGLTAARTINVSSGHYAGRRVEIKNGDGTCNSTNLVNITVSSGGTIDGSSSYILGAPYGHVRMVCYDGVNYTVI